MKPSRIIADFGYSKIELAFHCRFIIFNYTVVTKNRFTFDDVGYSLIKRIICRDRFFLFHGDPHAVEWCTVRLLCVIYHMGNGFWSLLYRTGQWGKRSSGRKSARIKPLKGSLAASFRAVIVGVIMTFFTDLDMSIPKLMIVTAILSVFGQVGDLVESALKRHYKVKDSGTFTAGTRWYAGSFR